MLQLDDALAGSAALQSEAQSLREALLKLNERAGALAATNEELEGQLAAAVSEKARVARALAQQVGGNTNNSIDHFVRHHSVLA